MSLRQACEMITANEFLEEVYDQLDYRSGYGYYPLSTNSSQSPNLSQINWLDQARQLGAESIFFVDDFPTVLFFKHDADLNADTNGIEEKVHQLFLQVWNTSRVPLFFLALPGELRVYSAYQKPTRKDEWQAEDRWLKRIETIAQIVELAEFSRPQVESGNLFQQWASHFKRENRVDQWLLKNLRLLRQKLEDGDGTKREYVHALIGRSIFIRYLEDRKVLVEEYFAELDMSQNYQRYTDVLTSKDATYHYLFPKLRSDFNGDLFPLSDEEVSVIGETDLHLLREFLRGRSMEDQPDLLFWAYKFDIIPIELVSNIYEEFYHENGAEEDKGTHYTPTPLVDFVLSQSLTEERLDAGARVLDAACGSGIFLVEAFKRMVYHACRQRGVEQLSRADLTEILTDKLVGFDVNHSAIQVAAFSLYLAYLDFREPPDIRANKRLPKLIFEAEDSETNGKTLYHTNAFFLTGDEKAEIGERIAGQKPYPCKADDIRANQLPLLPVEDWQFDVIVGNPPWGSDNSPDGVVAIQWCKAFRYPLGYKELSQCFMWRLQRLLNPGGEIGLLISTGVFFKHHERSQAFREMWLSENKVRAVYNFAHVRRVFFQSAISPFAAIFYKPFEGEATPQNRFNYVSIKRQAFIEHLQAVIIDHNDLNKVRQSEVLRNDWLWKAYTWGNLNDIELIGELKTCCPKLKDIVTDFGQGYQVGGHPKTKHTRDLGVDFELHTKDFYKNITLNDLIAPIEPKPIYRVANVEVYNGPRLLIKRGVSRSEDKFGEIQARLAYDSFAFRHSIIGLRLDSLTEEQQKVLLGIVLSSLAKYYHFLTCSTWGFWHDEIHVEEHLSLPVCFPETGELQTRIINAVNQIASNNDTPTLFDIENPGWRAMQEELDEAIFDLYELSESQRDLIRDLCNVALEFFYEGTNAQAVKPPSVDWLEHYKDAFLNVWQERLASRGKELEIKVFAPQNGLLVGMVFELVDLGTAQIYEPVTDDTHWQRWFRQLSRLLYQERSSQIYIDRTVKELTDSSIFIVKRAERRLWTKSTARQDAQELLTEVFRREWQRNGEPT